MGGGIWAGVESRLSDFIRSSTSNQPTNEPSSPSSNQTTESNKTSSTPSVIRSVVVTANSVSPESSTVRVCVDPPFLQRSNLLGQDHCYVYEVDGEIVYQDHPNGSGTLIPNKSNPDDSYSINRYEDKRRLTIPGDFGVQPGEDCRVLVLRQSSVTNFSASALRFHFQIFVDPKRVRVTW